MNELSLSTIKTIIRGCVVATPGQQLSIFELNREYRNQENTNIPHQQLGFSSVLAFLQSIPDTISVSGTDRFTAIVRPVASEKSAHVQSLVARTNPSSSRRRRPSSRHSSCPPPRHRSAAPHRPPVSNYRARSPPRLASRNSGWQAVADNRQGVSNYELPPRFVSKSAEQPAVAEVRTALANHRQLPALTARALSPMKEVSEHVEVFVAHWLADDIIGIVEKQPGMTLRELEESINKLGRIVVSKIYSDIKCLMASMTDTLRVENNRVYLRAAEANIHPAHPATPPYTPKRIPAGEEDRAFNLDPLQDLMQELYYNDDGSGAKSPSIPDSKAGPGTARLPDCPDYNAGELANVGQQKERNTSRMSEQMKERICQLLDNSPTGIWCSELPDKYKNTFQVNLNFLELRYVSIVQMLKTAPELFVVKQVDSSDWMVFDARKGAPAEPFITENTLKQIIELLSSKSNGIHIDEFPAIYQNIFTEKFDYKQMNYPSLEALFRELEDLHRLEMRPVGERYRLYPMIAIPNEVRPPAPEPEHKEDPSIKMLFPKEVVSPSYKFPELVLPPEVKAGADIEVLVEAVITVDRFYVQLRHRGFSKACEDVSDAMYDFYHREAGKYRVPMQALVPGLYAVAFINEEYNRLKIIRVNDLTVTAHLIDYGNREEINKKAVYFMHKDFARVPGQAILCRCANLRPPKHMDRFSVEAGKRLLSLVLDKGIVATITQFFPSPYWLWLCLVDTTSNEDIHIGDQLVNEGYAIYDHDKMTPVNYNPHTDPLPRYSISSCLSFRARLLLGLEQEQKRSIVNESSRLTLRERLKLTLVQDPRPVDQADIEHQRLDFRELFNHSVEPVPVPISMLAKEKSWLGIAQETETVSLMSAVEKLECLQRGLFANTQRTPNRST